MKKILIVFALLAMAAPSFAAQVDINNTTGSEFGTTTFRPSASVIVSYDAIATSYSAGAKHATGNLGYVSTSAESAITSFACATGTKVTIPSTTALGTACQ